MKQVNRPFRRLLLLSNIAVGWLLSLSGTAFAAPTLQEQINYCKTAMSITTSIPSGDCFGPNTFPSSDNPGVLPPNTPLPDRTGLIRVNEQVDMVFRCRNVNYTNKTASGDVRTSLEIILHNRQTGGTCFFSSLGATTNEITTAGKFPALDSANASSYPLSKDSGCPICHDMGGPYLVLDLASAKSLSILGVLNNGHDTVNGRYNILDKDPASQTEQNNRVHDPRIALGCGESSCHSMGFSSGLAGDDGSAQDLRNAAKQLTQGFMPPTLSEDNPYRWINLDTPTNSAPTNGVEAESFASAMSSSSPAIPKVALANPAGSCPSPAVPTGLEAHIIGLDDQFSFSTTQLAQLPDRLRTFNVKDGLVCFNADQETGQSCHDYGVRYLCSVSNVGTGSVATWSGWYLTDSPSGDGDHEERTRHSNGSPCGTVTPIGIQIQVSINGTTLSLMGPNDRLARFSPFGLTCNTSEQPDGKCSDYVVRYRGCFPAPSGGDLVITAAFSAIQLTASGSGNNALTKGQPHNASWNTQDWVVEPVTNTEYIRIKNKGTNTYLNVTSTAENATVVTSTFSASATGEQWTMEQVPQSTLARFKNLFSGKYLTIGDTSNFAPIYSRALNATVSAQKWIVAN